MFRETGVCDADAETIARESARRAVQPERDRKGSGFIFFLTFIVNNLIYESHCDFFKVAKFDVRENQSMKSATKKAAKKKAAPKKKK